MTSLKRHFLKKFPSEFGKIFRQGVKMMSDKVLKVLWRYLAYFSRYGEYSRGSGQNMPPSRAQDKALRTAETHGTHYVQTLYRRQWQRLLRLENMAQISGIFRNLPCKVLEKCCFLINLSQRESMVGMLIKYRTIGHERMPFMPVINE